MATIQINRRTDVNWQHAGTTAWELDAATVDAWHVPVTGDGALWEKLLSPSEMGRANRFRNPASRALYITGRAALRYLSARYAGTHADALTYMEPIGGKPYWKFPHDSLHFNTAHSGGHVLLCFARSEVGVDIEKINAHFVFREIYKGCFTQTEIAAIENAADPRSQFYLFWTRKEAMVKALGTGIGNALAFIPCIDGNHVSPGGDWTVTSINTGKETIASVAFGACIEQVRYFELGELE